MGYALPEDNLLYEKISTLPMQLTWFLMKFEGENQLLSNPANTLRLPSF